MNNPIFNIRNLSWSKLSATLCVIVLFASPLLWADEQATQSAVRDDAPRVSGSIDVDSIGIGDRFVYSIEVDKDVMQSVLFPSFAGKGSEAYELIEDMPVDTLSREGRRLKIRKSYRLAAFEEGIHSVVPQVMYADKNIVDTLYGADTLSLLVTTFQIDSTSHAIFDIKPQRTLPFKFGEISGYIKWVIIILLIVALLLYALKRILAYYGKNITDTNDYGTFLYVDASDDAICLKSHDASKLCQNVEVRHCVARSSANGIKFGTMGVGGFKNIKIIDNKVYDTYRSAFTIASVDGGIVDNVLVDSLYSANTGNAIYLRIGDRRNKRASMRNVTIQNSTFEVMAHKTDSGYMYEGPIEDNPRNLSPASIVGLAGNNIEGVTLRNVQIIHDGGGNRNYAYRGTSNADLESIPEMEKAYPEFSQFKELPAWGFFVRHAKDIVFDNVTFTLMHADYRPAVVMSDVNGATLKDVRYHFRDSDKPITKPEPLKLHKCKNVEK